MTEPAKKSSFLRKAFFAAAFIGAGIGLSAAYAERNEITVAVAGSNLGGLQTPLTRAMLVVADPYRAQYAVNAAAANGDIKTVDMLLNNGFTWNNGAVFSAATRGHKDMTLYLLDRASHSTFKKEALNEALDWAAASHNIDLVKTLIDRGADIHGAKESPLRSAVISGDLPMMKFLIERGADFKAASKQTIIDSIAFGHPEILRYAFDNGVEVDQYDAEWLPGYALSFKHPEMAQMIRDQIAKQGLVSAPKPGAPKL